MDLLSADHQNPKYACGPVSVRVASVVLVQLPIAKCFPVPPAPPYWLAGTIAMPGEVNVPMAVVRVV